MQRNMYIILAWNCFLSSCCLFLYKFWKNKTVMLYSPKLEAASKTHFKSTRCPKVLLSLMPNNFFKNSASILFFKWHILNLKLFLVLHAHAHFIFINSIVCLCISINYFLSFWSMRCFVCSLSVLYLEDKEAPHFLWVCTIPVSVQCPQQQPAGIRVHTLEEFQEFLSWENT